MGTSLFDLGFNGPGRRQPVQMPDADVQSEIPQNDVGLGLYFQAHPELTPAQKALILESRRARGEVNAHDLPAALPGAATRVMGGLTGFLSGLTAGPINAGINAAKYGETSPAELWANIKAPAAAASHPWEEMARQEDEALGVTPGSAGQQLTNEAANFAFLFGEPAVAGGIDLGAAGSRLEGLAGAPGRPVGVTDHPGMTTLPDGRTVRMIPEEYMPGTRATPQAEADAASPSRVTDNQTPAQRELIAAQRALSKVPREGSPLRTLQSYGPEEVVARQRVKDAEVNVQREAQGQPPIQTPVTLPDVPTPAEPAAPEPIKPLGAVDRLRLEGRRFVSDIGSLLKQTNANLGERGSIEVSPKDRPLFGRPEVKSTLKETGGRASDDPKFWAVGFPEGRAANAFMKAAKEADPSFNGVIAKQADGTFAVTYKNPAVESPSTAVAVRGQMQPASPRFGESLNAVPTEMSGGVLHSRLKTVLGQEHAGPEGYRTLDEWEEHLSKNPRVPKQELNDFMKTMETKGYQSSKKWGPPELSNLLDEHGIVNQLAVGRRGHLFTPEGIEREGFTGGDKYRQPPDFEGPAEDQLRADLAGTAYPVTLDRHFPPLEQWATHDMLGPVVEGHTAGRDYNPGVHDAYSEAQRQHYIARNQHQMEQGTFPDFGEWELAHEQANYSGREAREHYMEERDDFNLRHPFPDEETWAHEHVMDEEEPNHSSKEYEESKAAHARGEVVYPEHENNMDPNWMDDMPTWDESDWDQQDIPHDALEQEAQYHAEQEQEYNRDELAPEKMTEATDALTDVEGLLTAQYGEEIAGKLMERLHEPETEGGNPHNYDYPDMPRFPKPDDSLLEGREDAAVRDYMGNQQFNDDFVDEWVNSVVGEVDPEQLGLGMGEDTPHMPINVKNQIVSKLQDADEAMRASMRFAHDEVAVERNHEERAAESLSEYWREKRQGRSGRADFQEWAERQQEDWANENAPSEKDQDEWDRDRFRRVVDDQQNAPGSLEQTRRDHYRAMELSRGVHSERMRLNWEREQLEKQRANTHANVPLAMHEQPPGFYLHHDEEPQQAPEKFGKAGTGGYAEMLLRRPNYDSNPAKGHWHGKPGGDRTISHTRLMEFGPMGHALESQSDMGQLARGYNLPPEVWRKQLDAVSMAEWGRPLTDYEFQQYRDNAQYAAPMAGAYTDTEAWSQANVSMGLHEMARTGKDYYSWPNSQDRFESANLKTEGRRKMNEEGTAALGSGEREEMGAGKITYDKYLPQSVKRAVEGLGFKYEPEFYDPNNRRVVEKNTMIQHDVESGKDHEVMNSGIVTRIKLTPELRAAILKHGLPAMGVAAVAGKAAVTPRKRESKGRKSLLD